ncbi:MAG: TrmH family RNA methyltransferase [Candidatus Saccharimonadales bacterium]
MQVIVIAHNIRSTHNIGSILRTADGFGVEKVYCTGYTPYPTQVNDSRLPHERDKITRQIHKTALGAEASVPNGHHQDISALLDSLKADGYELVALEQDAHAILLPNFTPCEKIALLLGEEVHGISKETLKRFDAIVEIPMHGKKESFNVSVAAGIALYVLSDL